MRPDTLAVCHHMSEAAYHQRRATDDAGMSADHETLYDRLATRFDAGLTRIHERIDGVSNNVAKIDGKVESLTDEVRENGREARKVGERVARLDERSNAVKGTSNQTVAMRAIEAVERKPVLSITLVIITMIVALTYVATIV